MAVLSDKDLNRILTDNDGIIILNRREKSITGLGYDLTIGFIRDADTGEEPATIKDKDNNDRYTLLPGQRYLVISKEFIYLSSQYMATLHSRGSYALKGIIVSSTTVDPNYAGCITCSLFNCSPNEIYIKKENQFVTMVFHGLRTPTASVLQLNDRGMPMDTRETFHGRYSNIHPKACNDGDIYCGHIWESIKYEYNAALQKMYLKNEKKTAENAEIQIKEDSPKKEIMQITFLVGNGFDLNVGMKTGYRDFYDFYCKQCPDDLLARAIAGDRFRDSKYWSDLESGLGKYTGELSPEDIGEFSESEANLESKLAEYLDEQAKSVDYGDKERIGREMNSTIRRFYEISQGEDAGEVRKILLESGAQKNYAFVNFNYTDVLDQCLDIFADRFNWIHISPFNGRRALHVHGRIQERYIVLGVNDESQIANEEFRKSDEKFSLVKKDINKIIYKNENAEEMHSILDKSDIICIFGMSFGETDKMWWQSIAEWLKQDTAHMLIIFSREMNSSRVGRTDRGKKEKVLKRFFDNVGISGTTRETTEKQIYVIGTEGIFDFKLVKGS
ncbi:MAG: AbiH family protein [Butyricicoccus sp.]|nr:AbiH family protein [Butyricicoccus sp.]